VLSKTIAKVRAGMLLALLAAGGGMARGAATSPSTAGPATEPALERDAANLGSADFAARQAATQRLWRAGVVAEPFLQEAASSGNPETAARSQVLLKYIDDGIVPTTPPPVIHLLTTYQASHNPEERSALMGQLLNAGADGVRVLLRLRDHTIPDDRKHIQLMLEQSPRLAVALLLGEQNRAGAEAILDPHIDEDDTVAYWLVRGQLHDQIETYRRQSDVKLLSRLEWADGDGGAAMRDARESGDTSLVQDWLVLQADWPALSRQMQAEPPQPTILLEGARAMVCRFAGDTAAADKILAPVLATLGANANPNNPNNPNVAGNDRGMGAAMCINDRPDEAAKAWLADGMRSQASEVYQAQLRYQQMIGLLDHIDPSDADAVRLEAEGAGVLDFLGKHQQARRALLDAGDANSHVHDIAISGALCQSAAQMHRKDVNAYLLDALAHDADSWIFDMAAIPDPASAIWWWRCLRDRQTPAEALLTVEAVAGHHASKEDAAKLARTVDDWSQTQPAGVQPEVVKAIVAAMKLGGATPQQTIAVIRDHAESLASAEMFMQLGDALAEQHDWPAAAEAYGRAVDLDPTQPVAVFLHGWAMTQAGDVSPGKAQIELAHLLPLGDMQLRLDLFTAAHDRDLKADADRERQLMLAIGDPGTYPMTELLRICADDAEKRKDYAAAARYTRQDMVAITSASVTFVDQIAYLELPAQIHRLSAMADFADHKPDAAMPEAEIYYKDLPGDVDGLIGVIRLADATGATKQADQLFAMGHDTYVKLCQDYPDSGGMHNQLAWAEARCRRNLDDALAQAKRAVELDPDNTASIDTLAETYYQRHEFQNAIDTIQKCITLEPDESHHRKQLARFQLALKTGVADND
jgi:tetratricopeptide (TPR) repeat protein